MTSAAIVGGTGLVGSNILKVLVEHPAFTRVSAFSRRTLPSESSKLQTIEAKSSDEWAANFPPSTSIFFSGLGTTRGQAGSVENQRKIDYDLNVALATAAKAAGVDTYVLISTGGASPTSMIPYSKMKGELDEAVKKLGFKHCVILKPALLVGSREDSRPAEFAARSVANALGAISGNKLKDFWAQDADVVGKAAVSAGLQCINGEREEGVWVLNGSDIIRLGRTEWKLPEST
jgi:uncharacterized protein YbjT (DUF2867 family)